MEHRDNVSDVLNRPIVDGQQQITPPKPNLRRWRSGRHLRRDNPLGLLSPQHTVFDFAPSRTRSDICRPKAQEARNHDQRK
jgi:hypothetical protein